jgi:hypothetical protein
MPSGHNGIKLEPNSQIFKHMENEQYTVEQPVSH